MRFVIGLAGRVRLNATFTLDGRAASGPQVSGVAGSLTLDRGLFAGRGTPRRVQMFAVRSVPNRLAGVDERLAAVRRLLVLERYRNRRKVGFGLADPVGKGLEAIAVRSESMDSSV